MKKLYAYKATPTHLILRCNTCSTFYHKNGNLRKHPKIVNHLHGNCRDCAWNALGSTNRSSHCPHVKGNYDIIVNEDTIISKK